jgi:hypothetical protein
MGVGQIDVTYAALSGIINFTSNQLTAATVGVGDGTSTTWCSSSIYCANHGSGALGYNAALQTGATITGYITTSGGVSTLNVSTLTQGALAPGLILSGSGLTGAPTLSACTSDCVYTGLSGGGNGAGTTWTLSSNQGAVGSSGSPVLFTLAPSDGAIWPNSVLQQHYSYPFVGWIRSPSTELSILVFRDPVHLAQPAEPPASPSSGLGCATRRSRMDLRRCEATRRRKVGVLTRGSGPSTPALDIQSAAAAE